jgi:ferritin
MLTNLLDHATTQILDDAIHSELSASHLYKHIANQCQRAGLFGAAKFFLKESADELTHYQKLADYFNDRGGVATMPALQAEADPITDLETALSTAYDTEVALGTDYSSWYATLCMKDPMTAQFLLQFLEIQRLSIGEYGDLLSRLELAKGSKSAILMLDKELGDF